MKKTRIVFLGFILALIVDLFFLPFVKGIISDIRMFAVIAVWIILIRLMSLTSRATFILTLILFLGLFILFLISGATPHVERIATYIYLFLWVGVIHAFLEIRKKGKKPTKK